MASDFHTHNLPPDGVKALISAKEVYPENFTSLEIHPWYLPEKIYSVPEISQNLYKFDALGEIGLDKLRGPAVDVQLKYLHMFFSAAQETKKPVVLHIVKCYQELFALLKNFDIQVMIHGFCGSPELLDELWKRKITVSLSPKVLSRPEIMSKLTSNTGAFGFESDNSPEIDVRQILKSAGSAGLEKATDQYFADFLRI